MPENVGYPKSALDTGSVRRSKAGHGGHEGDSKEFGMTGGSTVVEGYPVDSGSAKHVRKPRDYNEAGTKARTFT